MTPYRLLFAGLAATMAAGCATLTSEPMQTVMLKAHGADGSIVLDAQCSLRNDRGEWRVLSPGFISVRRSAADLSVECRKNGLPEGRLRAVSRPGTAMLANLLVARGIGAVVDHASGAAYGYPEELPVRMGTSTIVSR